MSQCVCVDPLTTSDEVDSDAVTSRDVIADTGSLLRADTSTSRDVIADTGSLLHADTCADTASGSSSSSKQLLTVENIDSVAD